MLSMTTKYSSPRRTLMAKCPSTIRALSFSKVRQSRSLTGPQTETRQRIALPSASVPRRPNVDRLFAIEPHRNDDLPAPARGIRVVARLLDEIDDQPGHIGICRLGRFIRLECVIRRLGIRLQGSQRKTAPRAKSLRRVVGRVHRAQTMVTVTMAQSPLEASVARPAEPGPLRRSDLCSRPFRLFLFQLDRLEHLVEVFRSASSLSCPDRPS